MNSSALFDSTPVWLPGAEYFARSGIVYIGVTTSGNQSIPFLKGGCGGSQPSCGTRYASLSMTDNGQEYEMINQLVTALESGIASQVPLPADFPPVQHVFFSGQSQQGGSVITHASQFHFPGIAGYFFMGAASARAIRGGFTALGDNTSRTCGTTGALAYPDCVSPLTGLEQRVRTDLPAPVYRGSSETDIGNGSTRQDDTDTSPFASFRLIEVPATSHNVVHDFDIAPGLPFSFLCVAQPYSLADGPIFGSHVWNAMWNNMRIQVTLGIPPPHAPRVSVSGGVIQRDAFQNALGGVRLPELDVPTNSYFSPNNMGKPACGAPGAPPPPGCVPPALAFIASLACGLNGSYAPLPQATLDALYPSHGSYVKQIAKRTNDLVNARFLLPADAELHKTAAGEAPFGH
jgi:Alpha/beta hydrolase domain